jgi:UDP:flavonoid glycosyltransferase YjiC (YdhE family)
MRTLVVTPSGLGHIHPMVPLARALARRGHDVRWGVPADGVPHVAAAGFDTVTTGPAGQTDPIATTRRFPELADLPPQEVPELLFGKMFGAVATPAVLADLAPFAREWKPEVVVSDAASFAGHIVAAELGVPSVTKGFGALLPEPRVARAADEVAPLWRERGLEPRPYGGSYDWLYVDPFPPALGHGVGAHVGRTHPMRPVADDAHADAPADVTLPPGDAPLVYVTMGTVFHGVGPLRTVVDALSDLACRVLATVGPQGDPAALGELPAHVRVERYVPQTTVLPQCDVVVSHAGSGTALAAAALGLPQLCLPQGADQFLNAAAIAEVGAGISLAPDACDEAAVRAAVTRLLGDDAYRQAAGHVAASIASMPSPDDVAVVIESLA